ncbi:hypothetical protein BKA56DRAFT_598295 [Ilyonectria sp. MPI-CAGE-AT-0026]|nr:hypothetical protein BKA56DRAFT_598295 [Ilyonectria sp. MPI-CAGE-AT-0026]
MAESTTFRSSASMLSWDEDRSRTDLPRLTPATVKMRLPELSATVTSHYCMIYLPAGLHHEKDGNAEFTFSDFVEAEDFGGLSGSFIARGAGSFDTSRFLVEGQFDIVPGTATGELADLFKNGGFGSFKSDEKEPSKVVYVFNTTT